MDSPPSALVAPGAIVAGKYRLDNVIGAGGMGSVWAATHTGLGHAVAIKFVSREFVKSSEALRRFDAEAKAAAQLRSRHVVQVFDNGTLEDGTPYIAMELLRGENLYQRVHRSGPVSLSEAVDILTQCCKALGRAHNAGIIHRDIKPDNIFLAQSNDDDALLVKVLDFGIAKFAPGPNDQGATRTGVVVGTPLYMSPEQARGLKTIDHRTDLYSLGLVSYTLLTGNLAFSSESFGDLILQICTAPLPSLCEGAPWLPPAMEVWFQRACARDPEARYASAQDLADALRAAAGSADAASALPVSIAQAPPLLTQREIQMPSLGTASGMSRSGDRDVVPPSSNTRGALLAAALLMLLCGGGTAILVTLGRRERAVEPAASTDPSSAVAVPAGQPAATSDATPVRLVPSVEVDAGVTAATDAPVRSASEPPLASSRSTPPFASPHSAPPIASSHSTPPFASSRSTATPPSRPPSTAPNTGHTAKPIDLGY